MKRIKILSICFLCLIFNISQSQNNTCIHCNMVIKDNLHRALAEINEETVHFDAIECLINYLKINDENDFTSLKVADYSTGNLIEAKEATYIKSKAIPSPMGANLSAFSSKGEAQKIKAKKGGEIYSWESIKEKFVNSNFGYIDHSHHDHFRPDSHAPIGVMGDHLHQKGGFMLSLRYMNMAMNGNKSGVDNIEDEEIYNDFMVAPQEMKMDMYMLGVMYAPSNKLTLMLMQNFIKKEMDLTARMMMNGMTMMRDFQTSSSGISDLKISALYSIYNNHKTSLHLNGGLSIPVGDFDNRDDTPMMNDVKLPYAMQLGSGTFDITLGATFKGNYSNTSWGTQAIATFRTGKNSQDYRFGNIYQLNVWGAYKLSENFSVSGRVLAINQGKLKGEDSELNPMMVTTSSTDNYGNDLIKAYAGINIAFPQTSSLKDFRFGIEAGAPFYENYRGIQMNEDLTLNFGVKYNVL